MKPKYTLNPIADWKRYAISTAETFIATFIGVFLLGIENILDTGVWDESAFIALIAASAVAGAKVILKGLRESITKK